MDAEKFNLAFHALIDAGRLKEATSLADSALALDPSLPMAHYAKGVLAMFQGDLATAEREMRAVLAADASYAPAHHNLGAIAQWRLDYPSSIAHLRRALELDPANHDTAVALAQGLFARGDYTEGWRWFEAREGGLARKPRPRGLWDGTPLPGGALAVLAEHGLGDVVQFCRYIRAIRGRVARLYFLVDEPFHPLVPLLEGLEGVDAIVTDRRRGPPVNAYCPLMTVAHFAGASPDNPLDVPYLRVPTERLQHWRHRLPPTPRRRVGLVWAGNPRAGVRSRDIDARRSIDPALLRPLADIPGIEWHSLQLGAGAERRLPAEFDVVDATGELKDFGDTAALIANLDLVISVDTSVVHVAGAIGAPVWMLNRFDSCWRWGPFGEKSGWYPSLRIFRQPTFGDWKGAVDSVRVALTRFASPAA